MICKYKVFLGDVSLRQTVKFPDASELRFGRRKSRWAYKTRLNRQETSKKEGVKLSDSLTAIYTAVDVPKGDSDCSLATR